MNDAPNRDDVFADFLRGEIEAQERRNRRTWIGGLVLVGVLALYLGYITKTVCRDMLEPTAAADWAAMLIAENAPLALAETERGLVDAAPQVAADAVDGMMAMPGIVGQEARRQIDLVADDMLPLLQAELTTTLQAHLAEHADAAEALYAEHADRDRVLAFVNQLAADIVTSLDAELKRDSGHGVEHLVGKTLAGLSDIDFHLRVLNDTPDAELSREDLLHKRLVVMILRIVEDLAVQVRAEQGALVELP